MPPDSSPITWSECIACLAGDDDNCICPACNTGNDDDCYCDNGIPDSMGDGIDNTASPVDATMVKAQKIAKLNKAVQDATILIVGLTNIFKGWLGSTSQGDLKDSDFLWLSSAYKAGKESKSSGRKLPISIDGSVSVDGWLAAWNVLHGGQGGADFSGGPSKSQVMTKLLAKKPSGISIKDGHATRTQKSEKTVDLPEFIPINKADTEIRLGIIFGKASIANIADREGDVISEDELEKAAYSFMEKANQRATNTHGEDIPGRFVASYVEKGEWTIGFKPTDIEYAYAAARGDFVGFSIGGFATRIPIPLSRS